MAGKALAVIQLLLCISAISARNVTVGVLSLMTFQGNWAGPSWARYSGCSILAINHLNTRDTIMVPEIASIPADFNISHDLGDSGGIPSQAVGKAVDMILKGVDGFVGPLAGTTVGPSALIAGTYQLPLVGYAASESGFSDKTTYPFFARTNPSDRNLVLSIIEICKQIGWTHVSVLYQDDNYGRSIVEDVNAIAVEKGVQVLTAQKFSYTDPSSMATAAQAAANFGGRIFILAAYFPWVANMMFAAEDAGLVGPGYTWMRAGGGTTGGTLGEILASASDAARAVRVLSGVVEVRADALFEERMSKFTNALAVHDPETLYHQAMGPKDWMLPALISAPDDTCSYAYDSAIALGLALAHANSNPDGSLDRADVLTRLRNSDFQGATGHVRMDGVTGDRLADGMTVVVYSLFPREHNNETVLAEREIAVMDGESLIRSGAPYWAAGFESWEFIPGDGFQCREGSALSDATLLCEPCPPGTEQTGSACVPCGVGRHASEAGTVACPKCTAGFANATGQIDCHPCPHNTQREPGTPGESLLECVCRRGTYTTSGQPGVPCEPCPAGAECDGGTTPPYPQAGFWGERRCQAFGGELECDRWDEFLECRHTDCEGGPEFRCAPGRTGRLCRQTEDDWYNVGRIVFLECAGSGTAVAFLGIVGVVIAWCLIAVGTLYYASIDVLVQFMLVNAMITFFRLKWHSNLNTLNIFLKIANFDVDFVSPGCFGQWQPEHAFFLQLFLPWAVTALYMLFLVVYRAALGNVGGHSLSSNALRIFLALHITVYHTALYKSFATFRCDTYPDGKQYHSLHPQIECWQSSHISMIIFGIGYILLGGLALPAWVWYRINTHREGGTLLDDENAFTYSWLHERYVMKWKNWWAVVCFRRFAVALIAALVPWSLVQGMVTVMLIMALLTAQVMVRPHSSHRIDLLEFFSKVMTNLYVLGGMLQFGSITAKAQGRVCAEDATGVDALFCDEENDVKSAISIFSLVSMALTLAVAGLMALLFAYDEIASERAARRLIRWFSPADDTKKVDDKPAADHEGVPRVSEVGRILSATPVLRWLRSLNTQDRGQGQRDDPESGSGDAGVRVVSSAEFGELEAALGDLALHLNSSSSLRADILNKVCKTPGLMEWIAVEREGRESVLRFVNGFADFLRHERRLSRNLITAGPDGKTEAGGPEQKGEGRVARKRNSVELLLSEVAPPLVSGPRQSQFPVSDLIKREHMATAAYFMMTCTDQNRDVFCRVIDHVLAAASPTADTISTFRRSSTVSLGGGTPVIRQPSSDFKGGGPRRLSLDDYQAPQPPSAFMGSPLPVRETIRRSLPEPEAVEPKEASKAWREDSLSGRQTNKAVNAWSPLSMSVDRGWTKESQPAADESAFMTAREGGGGGEGGAGALVPDETVVPGVPMDLEVEHA